MNFMCGRTSSDKTKIFKNQLNSSQKRCLSKNKFTADCSCVKGYTKIDGQRKMKRLKSRKERSHMRGNWEKASKSKSHQWHCHHQTSNDMTHVCCHSMTKFHSGTDVPFPTVPAAQEPSIITDNRLIGHQGLFNHEVKSIDIERLLSEQKKLERRCQQRPEKTHSASDPSSTSNAALSSSINMFGADADEVAIVEQKVDPLTQSEAQDDFCDKATSQESDLTPGQRPLPQPDLSFGTSIASTEPDPVDEVKINSVMSEKGGESQQSPLDGKGNVKNVNKKAKTHTPKDQESSLPQTEAHVFSQTPPQLSISHTTGSVDMQHKGEEPDHTSQTVSALATRLCDCMQFPLMKRGSLLAESREVLLKALQERHGSQLQENLQKMQQCLSFGSEPTKGIQDQDPTMADLDSKSTKITESGHFTWLSSPHRCHDWKQTSEWWTGPVNTSVSQLEETIQTVHSPQFPMDNNCTSSDHSFFPSTGSWFGENATRSRHMKERWNTPKCKKHVMFGSFGNSFIGHTSAVREGNSGSPYNERSTQSFFHYEAQQPEGWPFGSDRYSFDSSFSDQIHHPQQLNPLEPLNQFSYSSKSPPLSSTHINMMHFPPSHMLDRDTARPYSSFPSPDHWSFPPLRLY